MCAVALEGLDEYNTEVVKRILEKYPKNYEISETLYLVSSEDDDSSEVARNVGIRGDDRIEGAGGIVFRLWQRYSGFADIELWEWLDDAFETSK